MRIGGMILAAAVAVLVTGCGGDDEPAPTPAPVTSQVATTASPTPASHELVVTVRDESPLDAYSTNGTTCTAPEPDFPPAIVVSDRDGEELASTPAPVGAVLGKDGSCEAEPVTMTVPYADAYTLVLGIDGDGVTDPMAVVTKGRSQKVTLIK